MAVIIDPSFPYDREIARGVAQYAHEVGDWRLYLEEEEPLRLPDFASWTGHGVIASFDSVDVARAVAAAGLPAVAVGGGGGHHAAAAGIPFVDTDDQRIGTVAADHLLERGLSSLGYYGLPHTPTRGWSQRRGDAFMARVSAAGKRCELFISTHEATQWQALEKELVAWLAGLPKPVGIMACDDIRARHVLEACRQAGLQVPHDVAVIGVDDDDLLCEFSDPPLTSVRQATRQIGMDAARLLDRLMRPSGGRHRNRKPRPPQRIVVPPIGVASRRSTQTLAVADPAIAAVIRHVRDKARGPLAIREVVRASGLSRWVLEERFRRAVGHSIHEDILRVRLTEAQQLVTTTDLPLKAIAPRAGFSSVAYMITLFRRHLGQTPAVMRRQAGR